MFKFCLKCFTLIIVIGRQIDFDVAQDASRKDLQRLYPGVDIDVVILQRQDGTQEEVPFSGSVFSEQEKLHPKIYPNAVGIRATGLTP